MQGRGNGVPGWDGGDARNDNSQEDDDVGNAETMECLHD